VWAFFLTIHESPAAVARLHHQRTTSTAAGQLSPRPRPAPQTDPQWFS
jgi:hypothetical protein